MVQIVPSILAADFAHLAAEIERVERGGATMLHVELMDGHCVPILTMGPPVVKAIRRVTALKLDLHLMITDPDRYAPIFIEAGADQISVQQEACPHLDRTLHMIQSEGAKAGVVINPATPVAMLDEVLGVADYVLVMSVNPGFGGQKFIRNSIHKIRQLTANKRERGLHFPIEIDGGVDAQNIAEVVDAGVEWVVAGGAIFFTLYPPPPLREKRSLAHKTAAPKK